VSAESGRRFDPVRMIEACCAPIADDEEWLRALLETVAPLEFGMGAAAVKFTLVDGQERLQSSAVQRMAPEALARIARFWEEEADPALIRAMFAPTPTVKIASRTLRRVPPGAIGELPRAYQEAGGARDALGVNGIDADGQGIQLTAPSASEIRIPAGTMHQLTRVSAHLISACRLRAHVSSAPTPGDADVEAVLDPGGRLHHAVAEAKWAQVRSSLATAVSRVERARGRLRRADPDEALRLWAGLVDGRWSLVDHCDSDGRRFVLARRNEPGVRDPKALAPRERDVVAYALQGHSNKYIGYLLGISASTVASHLESAMVKLGLRSRRELLNALTPRPVN
jgi:DNA-binding CsgD family transcriptional regulator